MNHLENSKEASTILKARFPDQFFEGRSGEFEFWDAKVAEQTPICRIEPWSAEDVSLILKILETTSCPFAVKAGGNSRNLGSCNRDGGVVVDLKRINGIRIANDRASVHVGPGMSWGGLYKTLEAEGITVAGAKNPTVGVGGFLLGGGLSSQMNRCGFACDTVLSFEVVLANGDIVTADSNQHSDLFRGLRGGGALNFGIVTSFQLEAIEQPSPTVWFALSLYPFEQRLKVHEENHKLITQGMEQDVHASGLISSLIYRHDIGQKLLTTIHYHETQGSSDLWPETYKSYSTIEGHRPMLISSESIEKTAQNLAKMGTESGNRNIWGTITHHASPEVDEAIAELWETLVEKLKQGNHNVDTILVSQPITRSALRQSSNRGGNAFDLKEDDGPLWIKQIILAWKDAANDEFCLQTAKEVYAEAETLLKKLGAYHGFKYINYAEQWQDVWAGLDEKSLQWLKQVQKKYDPKGMFTRGGLADGYFPIN